jgi:hypothetical protein
MRAALIALVLAGCVTNQDCEDRVTAATDQARADAPSCTFAPENLENLTCGGTDQSPELSYYAVWCGLADLSCIREDPVLDELCFGGA